MAEYTEKTRLLERLTDYYNCAAMDYTKKLSVCTAADCLSIVKKAPVADVVKVVHGEWIYKGIADMCSVCGRWLVIEQASADLNYCPNCGAKMDGERKDGDNK